MKRQIAKTITIIIILAALATIPTSFASQAFYPVFKSLGQTTRIYGINEQGNSLDESGAQIKKHLFNLGRWT